MVHVGNVCCKVAVKVFANNKEFSADLKSLMLSLLQPLQPLQPFANARPNGDIWRVGLAAGLVSVVWMGGMTRAGDPRHMWQPSTQAESLSGQPSPPPMRDQRNGGRRNVT